MLLPKVGTESWVGSRRKKKENSAGNFDVLTVEIIEVLLLHFSCPCSSCFHAATKVRRKLVTQ